MATPGVHESRCARAQASASFLAWCSFSTVVASMALPRTSSVHPAMIPTCVLREKWWSRARVSRSHRCWSCLKAGTLEQTRQQSRRFGLKTHTCMFLQNVLTTTVCHIWSVSAAKHGQDQVCALRQRKEGVDAEHMVVTAVMRVKVCVVTQVAGPQGA